MTNRFNSLWLTESKKSVYWTDLADPNNLLSKEQPFLTLLPASLEKYLNDSQYEYYSTFEVYFVLFSFCFLLVYFDSSQSITPLFFLVNHVDPNSLWIKEDGKKTRTLASILREL